MIIVMNHGSQKEEIQGVINRLEDMGFLIHLSEGVDRTIIGVIGDKSRLADCALEAWPGVEQVVPVMKPFKMVGRDFHPDDTIIRVGDLEIGGSNVHVMAGPCAVESREKLLEVAQMVKDAGATILRGGAFKPRTSPYSFQGLEEEGLKILAEAREKTGLLVATEAIDQRSVHLVAEYADFVQIGARNMQNFFLLREVSKINKPVILKRGLSATIEEWLMAAEYIISGGNPNVILCERGIRTYETYTRNTLDLSAIPLVKHLSHLPVIADPSHGTGKWRLVQPMAAAAIAAGADGLMIEVHQNPSEAFSDGPQSLTPDNFAALMKDMGKFAEVLGRTV